MPPPGPRSIGSCAKPSPIQSARSSWPRRLAVMLRSIEQSLLNDAHDPSVENAGARDPRLSLKPNGEFNSLRLSRCYLRTGLSPSTIGFKSHRHPAIATGLARRMAMDMTALFLSRIQFAFTITFHIIFPSFTIGLAAWLTVLEALSFSTGRPVYRVIFEFWLKIFGVAFGLGVEERAKL